jgi:Bacterial Ig domain
LSLADVLVRSFSQRCHGSLRNKNQSAEESPVTPCQSGAHALKLVLYVLGVLLFARLAHAQVTVTSPAPGATVAAPVHVTASAKSSHPVTAMRIYLDNVSVYLVASSQINTYISASAGSHSLVVQAWDSTGAVFKAPETINVATGGTPTPTPTPAPTPTGVFNEVQQWTGWQTCGACGNTGGGGALATYSMIRGISYPTLSGSSAEFTIGGNFPYADAYWYYRHDPLSKPLKSLRYEFDLYIPSGLQSAPQAIEFECQERLNGYIYNFGWQADYPANQWRVFNYTLKRWEYSGIPFQHFSPGTWHHIVAEYHNDAVTHTTYHDALTVDGVRYPLSIKHAATSTSAGNEFTNAFQLDLNGVPTAYKVYVDNMKITFAIN